MSEKVTYLVEILTPYKNIKEAILDMFNDDKPLYIAKNEDDETAKLEYIADITKIKALDDGFVIHIDKEKVTEIQIND
tara:strand:+ start:424 stop:657 length:234 start_codon:yes stop_codon:yes gene_type:complete